MSVYKVSALVAAILSVSVVVCAQPVAQPAPAAAVPPLVRYDGVFVPADGVPAASLEAVTLAVYDAPAGGSLLWEETQIVPVDAQGRYAVLLGATRADGLAPGILAGPEPRWLEARFSHASAGGPARVRLTSVPYALRASDADTLGGLPASAFLRTASADARDAGSTARHNDAKASASAPTVSTGTANYLGKFTNAVDLTSSVLFENAGQIGLGTTTPRDFLHVRFDNGGGTLTGLAVQNTNSGPSAYSGMLFYDQNGNLGQFQGFNNTTHEYRINNIASSGTINFMLASQSRFAVTAAGIGIGTTSPQDTLDITGGTGFVRSTSGLRMVSSQTVGVTQESNGFITNFGANDGRAGSWISGSPGGFFRVDTRPFAPLFTWYLKEQSAGTESALMSLNPNGTFYVPGVRATTVSSSPVAVMIDSAGQFGIVTSSRRYKQDIAPMSDVSDGLMKLRPVTFRYLNSAADGDGTRPLEYGLIAEEVADVYPDLVAHLANGEIETVQYHKINAMLLNEVQKQHREIDAQRGEITAQQRELDDLRARLAALEHLLTEKK